MHRGAGGQAMAVPATPSPRWDGTSPTSPATRPLGDYWCTGRCWGVYSPQQRWRQRSASGRRSSPPAPATPTAEPAPTPPGRPSSSPRGPRATTRAWPRQYSLLRGAGDQRRFCREHSLSFERMGEIQQQQRDLLDGLAALGFLRSASEGMQLNQPPTTAKNTASSALNSALTGHHKITHISHAPSGPTTHPRTPATPGPNRNAGQPRVLMAALCAGMYPNIARILRPPTRYVAETTGGLMIHPIDTYYHPPLNTATPA